MHVAKFSNIFFKNAFINVVKILISWKPIKTEKELKYIKSVMVSRSFK